MSAESAEPQNWLEHYHLRSTIICALTARITALRTLYKRALLLCRGGPTIRKRLPRTLVEVVHDDLDQRIEQADRRGDSDVLEDQPGDCNGDQKRYEAPTERFRETAAVGFHMLRSTIVVADDASTTLSSQLTQRATHATRKSRMLFLEPKPLSDLQLSVVGFARVHLGFLAFLFLFACWSQTAQADASVPLPAGWNTDSNASPQASNRGEDLEARLTAEMTHLASSPTEDEFIERVLVLRRTNSVPAEVLKDPLAAKNYATSIMALIYGQQPRDPISAVEFISVGDGPPVIAGTWATDDGLATRLVIVPKGLSEVLVVMEARRTELFFFGDVFRFVTENISGTEAPISHFSSAKWRVTVTLMLIIAGFASFFGVVLGADQTGAYEQAGKWGGIIMAGVSLLSIMLIFVMLRGSEKSLAAAGVSADQLALEAVITGLLIAGVCVISGRMLRKNTTIVASAPSHGIYSASSSQTSGLRPMISNTFSNPEGPDNTVDSSPMVLPKSAPNTATAASSSSLPIVTPSVPVSPQPPPRSRMETAAQAATSASLKSSASSNPQDSHPEMRPIKTRDSSATPRLNLKNQQGNKPKPSSDS